MSGITLSASVRQNLLSLQSTADLLSTTQNRLSTGNKVNSALDNPTNFFTAQSLNNRASDINNLLDGIGNGVQVIQAANTGITSLQKLVDSAKSVATQAQQSTIGYSAKSSLSVAISGATADNLLGNGPLGDTTFTGSAATNNQVTAYGASTAIASTAITGTNTVGVDATFLGSSATVNTKIFTNATKTGTALYAGNGVVAGGTTKLSDLTDSSGSPTGAAIASGDKFTIDGKTITIGTGSTAVDDGSGNWTIGEDATLNTLLGKIDSITGGTGSSINDQTGVITINTGATQNLSLSNTTGTPLDKLGLDNVGVNRNTQSSTTTLTGNTLLNGTAATTNSVLSTQFGSGDTLTINGKTLTFGSASGTLTNTSGDNWTLGSQVSVNTLLDAIDTLSGAKANGQTSSVSGGAITLHTGNTPLEITSSNTNALQALGLPSTGVDKDPAAGAVTGTIPNRSTTLGGSSVPGAGAVLTSAITATDFLVVNGKTITFHAGGSNTGSVATNDLSLSLSGNLGDLLDGIKAAAGAGANATIDATGKISLESNNLADITISGSGSGNSSILHKLGLDSLLVNGSATATTPNTSGVATISRTSAPAPAISANTKLSGGATGSSDALKTGFAVGDKITVNGKDIQFIDTTGTEDDTHVKIDSSLSTLLGKIDTASGNTGSGAVSSTIDSQGRINLHTGKSSDLTITANGNAASALASLGLGTASGSGDAAAITATKARVPTASTLTGQTLSFGSVGGGTATEIKFGDGTNGTVKSLNDLNAKLSADNLQATLAQDGTLTITTTNDQASASIGLVGGTATLSGGVFNGVAAKEPVVDAAAAQSRDNLVTQYNNILEQITKTAQDSSFNGVNLLTGDTLSLTFNETASSKLDVKGTNFNAAGLGLSNLKSGDFKDNASVINVTDALGKASNLLRSQASSFGSNLTIVQIRQDFSKNLINVLQTGSSNLTLADTNEEAANSQALSTRQSIAVSALSLANQSQQGVLQLLR